MVGASRSEPHTSDVYRDFLCMYVCMCRTSYRIHLYSNWGEPERAPRRRESHARIVYIYGTTVTRGAAHHDTIHCAHSKIFRAIQTACCNVCVLHCASVQHTLPRVQASFKRLMRFSSNLASFPGPTKERRGPGTHCLRMRRVPQKNVGHRIPS